MTFEKILELSGVSVRFKDRIILNEIDVQVKAGEFIGVIGPNGAGKTTLLRVILGLLKPSEGSVKINGDRISKGSRAIGYVPQKIQLDPDTPLRGRDLVGLGIDGHRWGIPLPSRNRRKQIDEVLSAVNALDFADSPVGKLSGGEQQRLLIAQALLTNPSILLLDEPLSNLDIRSAHEIIGLVSQISKEKGIAVMLVAHDMNPLVGVMDKILYLAKGNAVMGRVDDVIQNEVLTELYGYDVEVLRIRGRILIVAGTAPDDYQVLDLAGGSHCSGEEVMTH